MTQYYHIPSQTEHSDHAAFVKKLTNCGNPWMLDLAEFGFVPVVMTPVGPGQKRGAPLLADGVYTYPAVDKTPEEIKAETFVAQITPRQCRLWLSRAGLLGGVESMLQSVGGEALIEWEYASSIDRTHSLVQALVGQLGLTEDQLHQMFYEASKL